MEPFFPAYILFLSTPSARRATVNLDELLNYKEISIHALREEGDMYSARAPRTSRHFYPRPPRGGRRSTTMRSFWLKLFLSTPSARRATRRPS